MQPHWVEPAPLGEAQRGGMFEVQTEQFGQPQQQAAPQQDQRMIQFQMEQERRRLAGHRTQGPRSSGLGGLGGMDTSTALLGAAAALVIGGGIAYYFGRGHGAKRASRKFREELGDKEIKAILGKNPEDEDGEFEPELEEFEDEDHEEDED
jgi:hypothetical protein